MTEMHHNLEISTCDPLKYKMDNSVLILSTYMGESIRMKRVKYDIFYLFQAYDDSFIPDWLS